MKSNPDPDLGLKPQKIFFLKDINSQIDGKQNWTSVLQEKPHALQIINFCVGHFNLSEHLVSLLQMNKQNFS
jgi:hypothetical protein